MELLWVESGSPRLREVWMQGQPSFSRTHPYCAYKASICFSCISRVRDYCWKGMQTVMSLKCVMSKNKNPTPNSISLCNNLSPPNVLILKTWLHIINKRKLIRCIFEQAATGCPIKLLFNSWLKPQRGSPRDPFLSCPGHQVSVSDCATFPPPTSCILNKNLSSSELSGAENGRIGCCGKWVL